MLLAVYGTLRYGHGNWNHFLPNKKPLSTEKLKGWKMQNLFGFPGCKPSEDSKDEILIEVFDVNEEELQRIDRLEGYNPESNNNTFYKRITVNTSLGKTFMYEYMGAWSDERHILSGDWNNAQHAIMAW